MRTAAVLAFSLALVVGQDISTEDQNFLESLGGTDGIIGGTDMIIGGTPPQCDLDSICVPYYLCEEGDIITDGSSLIDIRFNSASSGEETTVNQHSECGDQYINVCCSDPLEKKPDPPVVVIDPVNPTETSRRPLALVRPYQSECGRRNAFGINARIIGAEDTDSQFGEFPWMAAILGVDGENLVFVGGATLIHPRVLVTGAHKVAANEGSVSGLVVRLGEWDTQHTTEFYPHVDFDVAQVVIHEGYNHVRRNLHNNIALLVLAEDVQLQEHIDTLCLPNPTNPPVIGSDCVATGWGKDSFEEQGQFQHVLKQVTLPLVDKDTCNHQLQATRLGRRFRLDKSFICAGGTGADTCTGDGGSPLACPNPDNPENYVLAGIVSWGIGCGQINVPGVYADVTYFADWINDNVNAVLP